MTDLIRGIDISAVQGDLSDKDWEAMAKLGVRFALLRLLVGNETWSDSALLKRNVERAKKLGIACGAYFFPYPLPHLDPKEQIERFVKLLEGLGTNIGELPPAYDAEWPPDFTKKKDGTIENTWAKWKCTKEQLCDWHLQALDHGESLMGMDWLVYSYRYHLKVLDAASHPDFAKRKLWLADYFAIGKVPTSAEAEARKAPAPWTEITIIQHDGDGGLKMPNGRDADFNVLLGGEDKLAELTSTSGVDPSADLPIDLTAAKDEGTRIMLEESIAAYRRERADLAFNAA